MTSNESEKSIKKEYISKNQDGSLSQFLHSFQNILNSFVQMNSQQAFNFQKQTNQKSTFLDRVDFRDRFVISNPPKFKNRKINFQSLSQWLGQVISQIFSVAFHYLMEEKMEYNQMKAFASESFLRNMILLAENCDLTLQQMEYINKELSQKIFPYLTKKYPLSSKKQSNKDLRAQVKEIDDSQMLQNDYLYSSNVRFQYREDARYEDLIMELLNEIIIKCNGKQAQSSDSNFKQFKKLMTNIFQKPYQPEDVVNQKISDKLQNNSKEKYKQKVKEYTSFIIESRISQNMVPYTKDEIISKQFKIKSPTILRILTKWCDQLWFKFENQNYFWQRKDGLSLNNTKQKCLIQESIKRKITQKMKDQKKRLKQITQRLKKINFKQQAQLIQQKFNHIESLFIQKSQRNTGLVACKLVNNLQSFIIEYLNQLIHSLLTVSKISHLQSNWIQRQIVTSPLNLLSFKIADILQCKYISKEKEALKVFQQIQKISKENNKIFKIIKIQNKLKQSTNDIIIGAKFNDQINCQIQIIVKTSHSDFMQCSNKINNFIFQLQKSIFGPVLQICSIWRTQEKRSETFISIIQKNHQFHRREIKLNLQKDQRKMIPYKYPFVCSLCHQHFYQNNFIVTHQSDESENYWKCAKCLIWENIASQNYNFFIGKDQNYSNLISKLQFSKDKQIPDNGACIVINRPKVQFSIFKKITHKMKDYLITIKSGKLQIMKEINLEKISEKQQFFDDLVVFKLPQNIVEEHFKINGQKMKEEVVSKIILPNVLIKCLKQQKQSISIMNEQYLSSIDMEKVFDENKLTQKEAQHVKNIDFTDCKLQNLGLILPSFKGLNRIFLNKNKIKDISPLLEFQLLGKIHLRNNQLTKIPSKIGTLINLTQLDLSENQLIQIPQEIGNLTSLTHLYLGQNQLKTIPKELGNLTNLSQLNIRSNQLKQIPQSIGNLVSLTQLYLGKNQLRMIPDQLGNLRNLVYLNLRANQLKEIPQSIGNLGYLTYLNLSSNQLRKSPKQLSNLKRLTYLNLSSNQLKQIPELLGNLRNLTYLNLSSNQLRSIPPQLGNLANITYLNLSFNLLTAIPHQLSELKNITYLNLSFNQLTVISQQISNLIKITQLDISSNQLKAIPQCLGNFTNLTQLYIRKNQFTTIPQQLGNLKNLTQLDLSQNQLKTIPQKICNLINLTYLNLSQNKLTIIPHQIGNLTNLTELYLGSNELKEVPGQLGKLISLNQLDLISNQLTAIPQQVGKLKNLTYLNLSSNKLTRIPHELSKLTNLTQLDLRNNPLVTCKQLSSINQKIVL